MNNFCFDGVAVEVAVVFAKGAAALNIAHIDNQGRVVSFINTHSSLECKQKFIKSLAIRI